MSRTIQLPPVVHMVADLDDLDISIPRSRRGSLVGRLTIAMRQLLAQHQRLSYGLVAMLLMVLIACSDSNDPVTPPRPVASVAVSPAAAGLIVGQTVELTATAKDASGNVLGGRSIQWSTNSATIATVSATGVVTAVAEGVATISAQSEGKVGQAQITVSRIPVARVGVTPTTVVLEAGATRQLTAVAFDANDNVLTGRTVQWSAEPASIATVSATGLVTAVAHGYAMITATVEGKSAASAVTVTEPEPVERYDVVYERRPFNGGGDVRKLSLVDGTTVTLPIVAPLPGAQIRDLVPSPDGRRVAFTMAWYVWGSSEMDGDIYVANINGSGVQRLTNAPGMDEQPAWSPDGTKIAFRSKRAGDWDIWVMAANGTGQVNLMTDVLPATSVDHRPTWSPNGSRILFSSDLDNLGYAKLWTMRADGSDKRRVAMSAGAIEIDVEASWSPDGTQIAFRRISGMGLEADIAIATVATGQVRRIPIEGPQGLPAWSPDGSRIAFSSSHAGLMSHIFTMKPDGSEIIKHTTGSDENTNPRWLRVQ